MSVDVAYLIPTVNRSDMEFLKEMNTSDPAIVLNQNGTNAILTCGNDIMISTATKGVGINRNIAMNLAKSEYVFIVDDDMVFYDGVNEIMGRALQTYPDADVILFNFDFEDADHSIRPRMKSGGRVHITNCLHHGICCTLVKSAAIRKKNISFSTLFGGGCKYGSGEDSLFFLDCVRKGLRIYTYAESVGKNVYRESTWFKGYCEKYFYDKGAWIACAFPWLKHLVKWYFAIRYIPFTELSFHTIVREINSGIKGFKVLAPYQERTAE